MRIAYQCNGFLLSTIGGAEVWLYHLTQELSRRGHELLILAPLEPGDVMGQQDFDGLPLVRLDFGQALASRDLAKLRSVDEEVRRRLDVFRPDVLHLNDALLSSFFFRRGGATGQLPRLLTMHSAVETPGTNSLAGRLVADADQVVAVSRAQAQTIAELFPGAGSKLSVIHNALPLPSIKPCKPPPSHPLQLFCAARLIEDKGIDTAIRALAALSDLGIAARLSIAGDGQAEEALRNLADELNVTSHVDFLGRLAPEQIPACIDRSSIVLMPSRWAEPFGLVALQAAQMERPAIVSNKGGLPEVVQHGETGIVLPSQDPMDWAIAIGSLAADPDRLVRMGKAARKRAVSAFDFSAMVDSYEHRLNDVIENSPRGAKVR